MTVVPEQMMAAVLHRPGRADSFVMERLPVPVPGSGEVLVRVKACGVSFRDVVERNGTYRRDVTFPLIIGLEISGEVVRLGEFVTELSAGDHVCSKAFSSCGNCRLCRTGRESTCQNRRPVRGGYAEYVSLPQDAFVRVPDGISFEESCALGPSAGVALNAVRDTARVAIGESVLITGASGGVGVPSVQLAKAAGAFVIASTRDKAKESFLKEIGADEVVVGPANKGLSDRVRAATDGNGVDVVIDTVGSTVFDASYNSLAVHGRYAMVGQLSGEHISINPARIFFKRAALLGVGSVSRAQLEDAIKLTARGVLRPQVNQVMPLREVAKAHRLQEEGAVTGRIVLQP